jgi:excisionase family DNA binding protein
LEVCVRPPAEPLPRVAYSPAEAAQAIGVTRQHIYNLMQRGELPSVKLGRSRRISVRALEALLLDGGADDDAPAA